MMPRKVRSDQDEGDEDRYHLTDMLQRSDPDLVEEVVAPQDLDRCPEDDDGWDRHTYVGSPLLAGELLAKDEEEADEAAHPDSNRHRVVLTEEAWVVAKHQ